MRSQLFIPDEVKEAISRHFQKGIQRAVQSFLSANEDEDTLTGHLGACLMTEPRSIFVENVEFSGNWTWSIAYKKFRGRGKNAPEKAIGADGLFEMHLSWQNQPQQKSVLFQSKMEGSKKDDLIAQVARLSNWREAAFVLQFAEEQFSSIKLDDIMRAKGEIRDGEKTPLQDFLSNEFLDCEVGDSDLRYDARVRTLSWKNIEKDLIGVEFSIPHRLKLEIKPPNRKHRKLQPTLIEPSEILKNRMDSAFQDFVYREYETDKARQKAIKEMTKIYHPDTWLDAPDEMQEILAMQMKELNRLREKK